MNYEAILEEIKSRGSPEYKEFGDKLMPGMAAGFVSHGVKIPELRLMAKRIAAEDWQEFACAAQSGSQEELILWGLVIACAKAPLAEKLKYFDRFVPEICNWAICDTVVSAIKPKKNELKAFRSYLDKYISSDREYEKRFALVCLMDYYINDDYVSDTLRIFADTESEHYYVKMAAAWGLQVCFVKYRDMTMEHFRQGQIKDSGINNKSIQKIRESYRVALEDKKSLEQYKKE